VSDKHLPAQVDLDPLVVTDGSQDVLFICWDWLGYIGRGGHRTVLPESDCLAGVYLALLKRYEARCGYGAAHSSLPTGEGADGEIQNQQTGDTPQTHEPQTTFYRHIVFFNIR